MSKENLDSKERRAAIISLIGGTVIPLKHDHDHRTRFDYMKLTFTMLVSYQAKDKYTFTYNHPDTSYHAPTRDAEKYARTITTSIGTSLSKDDSVIARDFIRRFNFENLVILDSMYRTAQREYESRIDEMKALVNRLTPMIGKPFRHEATEARFNVNIPKCYGDINISNFSSEIHIRGIEHNSPFSEELFKLIAKYSK